MRKIKFATYVCFLLFSVVFISCDLGEKKIDPSLLPGKWKQGTFYEVYKPDGTGYTWDEADDVTENEAQKMRWTLDENELVQIHLMEISGTEVPKSYTVTELSSTDFKYKDKYSSRSFTRVK